MTKQRPLIVRKSGQQLRLTIPKDLGLEAGAEVGILAYNEYLEILNNDILAITKKLEATETELAEAYSTIEEMTKEIATIGLDVAKESKSSTEEITALTLSNNKAKEEILALTKDIARLEKEAKEVAEMNSTNKTRIATLTKEVEKLQAVSIEKDKLFNSSYNSIKLLATEKVKATATATIEEATEDINKQLKAVGFFNRLTGNFSITKPKVSDKVVAPILEEIESNSKFILPAVEETAKATDTLEAIDTEEIK